MQNRLTGLGSYWVRLCRQIAIRFLREHYTYRASALTFTTLLAIVPFFSIVFSIFSIFPVSKALDSKIQHYIFSNFLPAEGEKIEAYLTSFVAQSTKLPTLEFCFLIIIAVMLLLTIEHTFNAVWQIKKGRRGISAFISYWAVISLTPLFIGLSLAVSSYIFSLPFVSTAKWGAGLQGALLKFSPFVFSFIGFTLLYIVVPNCKVKFRYAMLGGFVAALLFELTKYLFGLYIHFFPTYALLYGALAVIPIFLLWVYLCWLVILFGVLVSHAATINYLIQDGPRLDGFTHAYLWLGLLWQARHQGKGLSLEQLCRGAPGYYRIPPYVMLRQLQLAHLITDTHDSCYLLSCDFAELTLHDLYNKLSYRLPDVGQLEAYGSPWCMKLGRVLRTSEEKRANLLDTVMVSLYCTDEHNGER